MTPRLKANAGVKIGALYLLLLEVEELGRSHLHGRRGALGPSFPGPGVHVHASVLTGWSVAGRLGPRFLHHDLKIWRRRRKREREGAREKGQERRETAVKTRCSEGAF